MKIDYAFLVHSRDLSDLYHKFPAAKYLPDKLVEAACSIAPPFTVAKINGPISVNGIILRGCIIGIPLTAKQMLARRDLASQRVREACDLAFRQGARLVGLGALTSTVTKGGHDLIGKVDVKLTNGNALTAGVAYGDLEVLIGQGGIKRVGILGATGSIGSALTILLASRYPELEYYLIGRSAVSMAALEEALKSENRSLKIKAFLNGTNCLAECDLVVVATSASEVLLGSECLRHGATVYDVTQPRNLDPKLKVARPDLTIVDGGGILAPDSVKCGFYPIFKGQLVFSCLAETMILAAEGKNADYSIGQVEPDKVREMIGLAQANGFERTPLICWNE